MEVGICIQITFSVVCKSTLQAFLTHYLIISDFSAAENMTESGIDAASCDIATHQDPAGVGERDIQLNAASSESCAAVIPCGVEATPALCCHTEAGGGAAGEGDRPEVSQEVVDQLTRGLLAKIVPSLDEAKTTLSGITCVHALNVNRHW